MVEQQRFRGSLQHVDQEIVAADVRQLVPEQSVEISRRKPGERGNGHQDRGTKPADHGGNLNGVGNQQSHGARDAEALRKPLKGFLPMGRRCGSCSAPQPCSAGVESMERHAAFRGRQARAL